MLRGLIAEGKDWSKYVPEATYRFILENGIDQRIKKLIEEEEINKVEISEEENGVDHE